jgi:integrase
MASIAKRGDSWRVRLYVNGQRESQSFATKREAAAWAQQREAELTGKRLPEKTLGDAMEKYAANVAPSHRGHRWEVVRLSRMVRDDSIAKRQLAALAGPDFAAWRDDRLKEVQAASVAREMNLIKSVLRYARVDLGWLRSDPMADIKRPGKHKARDRRVSDDEIERMRCALGWPADVPPENQSQRIAVMMLVAVETAMRSGEMCSLTWPQVFLKERYVRLEETKNGDTRDVPLSRRAGELLDLLPRDSATVFGVSDALRDALWRKARARAEIVGLTFHDLRHEATTRLARKLDVLDLSRMTGHRDLKSLRRYYNPSATEIAGRLD